MQLNLLKNPQKGGKEGNTSSRLASQLRAALHLYFAAPASKEGIAPLCSWVHFDPLRLSIALLRHF